MAAHVRPHPLLSALSRARVARAILSRTEEPWLAALWLRELDEALAADLIEKSGFTSSFSTCSWAPFGTCRCGPHVVRAPLSRFVC